MEAPEFFQSGYYRTGGTPKEKRISTDMKPDHFIVEDLFDFSNEDENGVVNGEANFNGVATTESSSLTVMDSCNSSFSNSDPQLFSDTGCGNLHDGNFSNDLCVPILQDDDLAELEWLSNFVEESFSSQDLQKLQLLSGMKARPDQTSEAQLEPNNTNPIFRPEMPVPGKARSKRSRAAPCNWTSRILVLSPTSSSSESDGFGKKTIKVGMPKKKDGPDHASGSGDGRKCLHCATDKTPQWRTGPMGPKTLCNACGVRYKSGRLVPEYRPAASPTFVQAKHSNSHRKVLELRRQKEMQRSHHPPQQQQQYFHHHRHQNMVFDVTDGEDYLIHQRVGPDYRQLI